MDLEGGSDDVFDYVDQDATIDDLLEDIQGPSDALRRSVSGHNRKEVGKGRQQTPASRIKHAAAAKAEQSNDLREKFFFLAMGGTGALLAVNIVLFALYMTSQWNHIADAVMVTWITSTVVEVLGIIYIIAKYLFDERDAED